MEDLRPWTLDHFQFWCSLNTLDNGRPWVLEDFQREILADVFAGYRETLAVLSTGSYKTTTFGGLGVYHLQFVIAAQVPVGAASKVQAGILYEQAAGFIRRSKFLQRRFKVQDGYRRIAGLRGTKFEGRVMRVYAADADKDDGVVPSLALIDELHRQKGSELYGIWRDKLTKRDGQLVALSTAGDDETNPLEELREAAHRLPDVLTVDGRHTVARSKGREFVMHEWALRKGDDVDDLAVVKMANPASQVTIEELRMRRDSPSTKRWQWLRFTCNVAAKGEESAIQPEDWDARRDDGLIIPSEIPVYLGMDLGWKIDHASLTPVGWDSPQRRLIAGTLTIAPPVDELQIVAPLLLFCELLNVRAVVYDPNAGGQQMVRQLEKGKHELQTNDEARQAAGLPPLAESRSEPIVFVEHPQDPAPMVLASERFDEALRFGWIRHDGGRKCSTGGCRCGGLRGHVLNAVARHVSGEKWRYDRPASAQGEKRKDCPIDGLTGALIAHSVAVAEEGEGTRMNVEDYRIERV